MQRLICVLMLVLTACQTMPTDYSEVQEGHWAGRVLVKDLKGGKSYIVNIDINAVRPDHMRMEVTAALGNPVAVLVIQGEETRYLLFDQKRYYEGKTKPQALRPILSVDMDPALIFNVLFDLPVEGEGWTCTRDKKGMIASCENDKDAIKVAWIERRGKRKVIKIDHGRAQLQMNLNEFQPKVAESAELFNLKAPNSFKKYRF